MGFIKKWKKLRIGVPNQVSYKDFIYGVIEGYCIDVFIAALNLLPYPVPYEFVLFGDGRKNPSYGDFVKRIMTNVQLLDYVLRSPKVFMEKRQ